MSLTHFLILADVLIFLKLYDPRSKSISYCGHLYVPISTRVGKLASLNSFVKSINRYMFCNTNTFFFISLAEILPELCRKAGFPPNTPLILYEVWLDQFLKSFLSTLITCILFSLLLHIFFWNRCFITRFEKRVEFLFSVLSVFSDRYVRE